MSDITVTTTAGGVTVVTDTLGAATAAAAAAVSAAAASSSASAASASAANALTSENNAETAEANAEAALNDALAIYGSIAAVQAAASAAAASSAAASASELAAETAETNAETAETNAETAQTAAAASAVSASASATTATNQAAAAAASALSAASVVSQDLSAIDRTVFSATIVDTFLYDTSKDSDGGAWRKRCAHTSWENETLSGNWLGSAANETAARLISGATTGSLYYDTTAAKFYTLNAGSGKTETFRGSTRKFPAKVLITVEAGRVVLWDITQANAPMWMVLSGGADTLLYSSSNASSATALNGVMVIGKSGFALTIVNFIKDRGELRDAIRTYFDAPAISGRNSAGHWGSSVPSNPIVSNTVNDVAMIVLPNAPVDVATGLPVPTIAVATDGGVSVIKDDGNVWDITATEGAAYTYCKRVIFIRDTLRFTLDNNANTRNLIYKAIPTADTTISIDGSLATAKTAVAFTATAAVPKYLGGLTTPLQLASNGKSDLSIAGPSGLTVLRENPATPANGMVAYITKDYNSGWMVGDIRGAWLADTVAETLTGTDTDRSVKANNLTVNGSLTKAVVASGAQLVGYSGFSAANYLSQAYDADFDFGTGDFCIMGWLTEAPNSAIEYLFNRDSAAPGKAIRLWVSVAGYLVFELYDGTTTRTATGTVAVDTSTRLFWMATYSAGTLTIYVNGVSYATATGAALLTLTNASAVTRVGLDVAGSYPATNANMALVRAGATVPSTEQIQHIYETERPMFEANASCVLAGSSNAVTALAYDDETDLLHVGTSYGRSAFKGLVRVSSEATAVGAITALAASAGVIVQGGASGADVYVPAYTLREELLRDAEQMARFGQNLIAHDFTATASQTTFTLPVGWEIVAVYQQGAIKRETTSWTRSFDGFKWSAVLGTGATVSDWISILAKRV